MAPQTAIKKITEKYSKQETATGKLTRPKFETFFVSGIIKSSETYKNKLKKTGSIKEQTYNLPDEPFAVKIRAKNKAEAEEKFIASSEEHYLMSRSGEDSNVNKTRKFQGASVSSVSSESSFTASRDNPFNEGIIASRIFVYPR